MRSMDSGHTAARRTGNTTAPVPGRATVITRPAAASTATTLQLMHIPLIDCSG
jgi:hypothetical protein